MRHQKVAGSDLWTCQVLTSCFGSVSKTTNQDLRMCLDVGGAWQHPGRYAAPPTGWLADVCLCECMTTYQHTNTITLKFRRFCCAVAPFRLPKVVPTAKFAKLVRKFNLRFDSTSSVGNASDCEQRSTEVLVSSVQSRFL